MVVIPKPTKPSGAGFAKEFVSCVDIEFPYRK
jgi:hypothetical protein